MGELANGIADSINALDALVANLNPSLHTGTSGKWVAHWRDESDWAKQDLETALIPLSRADALFSSMVSVFTDMDPVDLIDNTTKLDVGKGALAIDEIRYALLTSYQMSVWSVYDAICTATGRLYSLHDNKEPCANFPRLPRIFKDDGDLRGLAAFFSVEGTLPLAFRCPINLSYCVRNALAHSGGCIEVRAGHIPLLEECSQGHEFDLNLNAADKLERISGDWGKSRWRMPSVRGTTMPKPTIDVRDLMRKCNAEIDYFIARYLVWSINAYVRHIEVFLGQNLGIAPVKLVSHSGMEAVTPSS